MELKDQKHPLLITNDDIQYIAECVVKLSQDKTKPFNAETVADLISRCLVGCTVINQTTP
jgi:hypothetical protein